MLVSHVAETEDSYSYEKHWLGRVAVSAFYKLFSLRSTPTYIEYFVACHRDTTKRMTVRASTILCWRCDFARIGYGQRNPCLLNNLKGDYVSLSHQSTLLIWMNFFTSRMRCVSFFNQINNEGKIYYCPPYLI